VFATSALAQHYSTRPAAITFVHVATTTKKDSALFVIGIQQTSRNILRILRRPCVEHSELLHLPFAKGRIENGLAPAPRMARRGIHKRFSEALSVLAGRSIAVRCYEDKDPPEGADKYVDGTVGHHPIVPRQAESKKATV